MATLDIMPLRFTSNISSHFLYCFLFLREYMGPLYSALASQSRDQVRILNWPHFLHNLSHDLLEWEFANVLKFQGDRVESRRAVAEPSSHHPSLHLILFLCGENPDLAKSSRVQITVFPKCLGQMLRLLVEVHTIAWASITTLDTLHLGQI